LERGLDPGEEAAQEAERLRELLRGPGADLHSRWEQISESFREHRNLLFGCRVKVREAFKEELGPAGRNGG
jgi:hypothetical protein